MVSHLWFALVICLAQWRGVACTLTLDQYHTAALHGKPASSGTVDNLDFNLDFTGSAEITGMLALTESLYSFDCTFTGGQLVFVWVGDHLVCHTDPPFGNAQSSTDGCPENPLPGNSTMSIVIHIYSASADGSGNVTSDSTARVNVQWAAQQAPLPMGAHPSYVSVPSSALSPESSNAEIQRRTLQKSLQNGWNTWYSLWC